MSDWSKEHSWEPMAAYNGNLDRCPVCGSFEGATTTHCPGRQMGTDEADAVYAAKLDFEDGAWREQPSIVWRPRPAVS